MTQAAADPVVLINVYSCPPDRLDQLMDLLTVLVRAQREIDGFVSATLHRGLDGKVAAVHAVWESRQHWKSMARDPAINAAMEPIMAIATFAPHLYEAGEIFE